MTTVLRGAIAWTLTLMLAFLAAIPSGLSAQRAGEIAFTHFLLEGIEGSGDINAVLTELVGQDQNGRPALRDDLGQLRNLNDVHTLAQSRKGL